MDLADGIEDLLLTVDLAGAAIARRSTILAVRLANRGAAPATVSARLNLFEGDVRLLRRDPSGDVRRFDGWQIDTMPREVELPAGRAIAGALNLLETADGPLLCEAGPHELAAEYFPGVARTPVASAWVRVEVAAPERSAGEDALDVLLADRTLRRALVKADAREAPEAMERLAAAFPESPDGELAVLILAGGRGEAGTLDWGALSARHGMAGLAMRLLALRTPYSDVGARLAEAFAAALPGLSQATERELARQLVLGEPVPA